MTRPVRASGILLHITSLPSAFGIGDMGPAAHAFARLLAGAGQTVWQFLPLAPTSTFIGNSPYSSPSAFAGNTLPFISYSGSSITMVFASIGIMLNIVRCSNQQRESSKGRSNRAVVDLRGRNSGRGVSRAGRSASTRQ